MDSADEDLLARHRSNWELAISARTRRVPRTRL